MKDKIHELLQEHLGIKRPLKDSDRIIKDLNADSLDQVELMMNLEEIFDIEIPDEDWEKKKDCTVSELVSYIKEKSKV